MEIDFIAAFNQEFGTKAQLWQKHGLTRIYLNDRKLPAYIEVKNGVPQAHPAAPSEMNAFIKANTHLEICAVPVAKAQSFREQLLATASQPDSIQDSWAAYHGQKNTEKALNAMYGKGGWDRWDREDYEG